MDRAVARRRHLLADLLREAARTARPRAADRRRRGALRLGARQHRPLPPGAAGQVHGGHRPPDPLVQCQPGMDQKGDPAQRPLRLQQSVVAPVDGEADHVLRDDATRPAGAGHLADPAQGVRALRRPRADAARLRPLLRPRRDRPAARLPVVHEALQPAAAGSASAGSTTSSSCATPTSTAASSSCTCRRASSPTSSSFAASASGRRSAS